MQIEPLYALSGAAVGFTVGLTGVGGGSLMTPVLMLLFGVHPATAVGTDLLYAAITKSAGSLVHGVRNNVDWRIVGRLAAGSVPASALTLLVIAQRGAYSAQVSRTIGVGLGIALLLTSLSVLLRQRLLALRGAATPGSEAGRAAATVAVGAALGVAVSISSVGAGAIGVTALLLLYPATPIVRIVGSDIAHAVPLTFVAGAGHWMMGSVDLQMLASLLVGSIPGVMLGARLAPQVHESALRILLAVVLAIVGLRLVTG